MSSIFRQMTPAVHSSMLPRHPHLTCIFWMLFTFLGVSFTPIEAGENDASGSINSDPQPVLPTADNISPLLREIPLKTHRRGILEEETDIYFQTLGYIQQFPVEEVKRAARKFLEERQQTEEKYRSVPLAEFPVFVDLYQHPEIYQGKPVTMSGHIQRSVKSLADRNEYGIENLCEAWLFTPDAQANPTVVIAAEFPPEFPIGEQTVDRVTVTGYIYRLYTYDARDAGRFAPLIMARQIDWSPGLSEETAGSVGSSLLILLATILLLAFFLAMQWHSGTRSQRPRQHRELPAEIVIKPDARHEVQTPVTKENSTT